MAAAIGQQLGSYKVTALLGKGGMGEVYRARDSQLNRDIAIKVLPESVAHDPDSLARFRQEAQSIAALNHPKWIDLQLHPDRIAENLPACLSSRIPLYSPYPHNPCGIQNSSDEEHLPQIRSLSCFKIPLCTLRCACPCRSMPPRLRATSPICLQMPGPRILTQRILTASGMASRYGPCLMPMAFFRIARQMLPNTVRLPGSLAVPH